MNNNNNNNDSVNWQEEKNLSTRGFCRSSRAQRKNENKKSEMKYEYTDLARGLKKLWWEFEYFSFNISLLASIWALFDLSYKMLRSWGRCFAKPKGLSVNILKEKIRVGTCVYLYIPMSTALFVKVLPLRVREYLEVMAMKEYFIFPKAPGLEPHHQRV